VGLKPSEFADAAFPLSTSGAQRTEMFGVIFVFFSKLELSCVGQAKVKGVKGKGKK